MEKGEAYWKSVHAKAFEQLAELQAERETLSDQLTEINKQIIWLEQILSGVNQLTSDTKDGTPQLIQGVEGLTLAEACRVVLQASGSHRTPRGIRDSLEVSGYDLSQHNNPLASIHGVIKRFVESGQVEPVEISGKTRYRWKSARPARPTREQALLEAERRDLEMLAKRTGKFSSRIKTEGSAS